MISFGEINPDKEVTFGDLIPGVEVILVDEMLQERDHGEVLIAGPGLAAGYLNNPTLTAAKFIELNDKRFYRTGDLSQQFIFIMIESVFLAVHRLQSTSMSN
ncbi:hypothetical protein N7491_008994 [Penicillium cf. griseofulvum]|uniref:AMP-dependent synthetase/ligase domain-containing protein n=1 Tax=Penicillium cf. griseofulvum TaxID=2972120 RepID=A0A9W9JUB9_9EURO|nr:hypothetical protein N7472_005410 [Penicillium cf. griseofulvum]KAJ5423778.1 hypothetical protein N7491_008994 [Penicillium cf. griseofulvum]KAJ5430969.1 hypothetical protein N7445_008701 [Penicillium cf. griseofulvum]